MTNVLGYLHVPELWFEDSVKKDFIQEYDASRANDIVHSATTSFDVDVIVRRQGGFDFAFDRFIPQERTHDWENLARRHQRRYQVLDAHLACLNSSASHVEHYALNRMTLDPDFLMRRTQIDDLPASNRGFMVDLSMFPPKDGTLSPMTIRNALRMCFPVEVARHSIDTLSRVHDAAGEVGVANLALLNNAAALAGGHRFSFSLIVSWSMIERILNVLWDRFLNEQSDRIHDANPSKRFIGKERLRTLTGRDYTASVMTETLSLADKLPFSLYEDVNKIRRSRNQWIHGSTDFLSTSDASSGVAVATRLFNFAYGLDLRQNVPLQLSG